MPNRSATKTRARTKPPSRVHARASNRALARAKARRAVVRRRLLRVTAILLASALLYGGGAGTGFLVMKNRMESRMEGLLNASNAGPAGATTPDPGAASDQVDLQQWAREQGLPEGVPEQALAMLHQQYPDEIPPEIREQILEKLGGD
jgi:hypothetical protein